MTKQKKPKTGDVVAWILIDRDGDTNSVYKTRKCARDEQKYMNVHGGYGPYTLGKVVKA